MAESINRRREYPRVYAEKLPVIVTCRWQWRMCRYVLTSSYAASIVLSAETLLERERERERERVEHPPTPQTRQIAGNCVWPHRETQLLRITPVLWIVIDCAIMYCCYLWHSLPFIPDEAPSRGKEFHQPANHSFVVNLSILQIYKKF